MKHYMMNIQKSLLKPIMVFNNVFLKCGLVNIQLVRNNTYEIYELVEKIKDLYLFSDCYNTQDSTTSETYML